eukprot:m.191416 g.191416  ORF g.191416 m.191416 type:complete len:57 (+) comp18335_c0_seq1:43-213(+)
MSEFHNTPFRLRVLPAPPLSDLDPFLCNMLACVTCVPPALSLSCGHPNLDVTCVSG